MQPATPHGSGPVSGFVFVVGIWIASVGSGPSVRMPPSDLWFAADPPMQQARPVGLPMADTMGLMQPYR